MTKARKVCSYNCSVQRVGLRLKTYDNQPVYIDFVTVEVGRRLESSFHAVLAQVCHMCSCNCRIVITIVRNAICMSL
ncbi:hypothetical protein MPTK1_7g18450 [Marchantia polymorpha subsp. ruderalis]|uniref:Uncharacterized protein n=2 Tax=Marchantia polymorpha TaxID=3197 RepID=A0AAF6C141_MARPO|nr:hypothetical protein MARPO_0165s0005 [Marchantia polymorpha]BBN17975.1 hypothetical protein Mp_7g18450 [Marchantia polymorpha subsp. ruderalis]|eukprot:PTQ28375.1 hypothetical protein MARPO_0165s0005 [Marchantia polymorpha]